MNKYILMALCMFCASHISAQKDMVVRKKDGTALRIPLELEPQFGFWGKNVANDNDYITVSDITGPMEQHGVKLELNKDYMLSYESCGIVWGENPGVTVEYGNKAVLLNSDDNTGIFDYNLAAERDLKLETTYYYRAYVTKYGKTYYSEEKSHTFYPHISTYLGIIPKWDYSKSAYVIPSDETFKTVIQENLGVECSNTSLAAIKKEWISYIDEDIAKTLISNGGELKKFHEGDLYIINSASSDFIASIFKEGTFHVSIAHDIDLTDAGRTKNAILPPDVIECDETFGIKDNQYYKFYPSTNVNQQITFNMPVDLLPGYTYKINIVFAPDTEVDSLEAKKSIMRFNYFASNQYGEIPTKGISIYVPDTQTRNFDIDNATKCDTVTLELEADNMQKLMFQIITNVSATNLKNGYTREIRISEIYVERKKIAATE